MGSQQSQISNQTVNNFDPDRYTGKWHEIARYPIVWENDCDGAIALYDWDKTNQRILVENQCYQGDNMVRSRTAKAWIPDPTDKSKLLIKFDDIAGIPSFPGPSPYWVHWTDYDNYSIVGGPSRRFLWILSREPQIKANVVENLLQLVRSFGYDSEKLMATPSVVIP